MAFTKTVVEQAFRRQAGLCAHCGKTLVTDRRDRQAWGAWHTHHRTPSGGDSLRNCVILCSELPQHCHLKVGHGGEPGSHPYLHDCELPYFNAAPSSERPFPVTEFAY